MSQRCLSLWSNSLLQLTVFSVTRCDNQVLPVGVRHSVTIFLNTVLVGYCEVVVCHVSAMPLLPTQHKFTMESFDGLTLITYINVFILLVHNNIFIVIVSNTKLRLVSPHQTVVLINPFLSRNMWYL